MKLSAALCASILGTLFLAPFANASAVDNGIVLDADDASVNGTLSVVALTTAQALSDPALFEAAAVDFRPRPELPQRDGRAAVDCTAVMADGVMPSLSGQPTASERLAPGTRSLNGTAVFYGSASTPGSIPSILEVSEAVGTFLAALCAWAAIATAATPALDDDLTERVKHPMRFRLKHPIKALRRSW